MDFKVIYKLVARFQESSHKLLLQVREVRDKVSNCGFVLVHK